MTRLIRQQADPASSSAALMVYCALHNVHQPVESPPEFVELYPESDCELRADSHVVIMVHSTGLSQHEHNMW